MDTNLSGQNIDKEPLQKKFHLGYFLFNFFAIVLVLSHVIISYSLLGVTKESLNEGWNSLGLLIYVLYLPPAFLLSLVLGIFGFIFLIRKKGGLFSRIISILLILMTIINIIALLYVSSLVNK